MGKGYQAKHVVRQAVAASSNDAVIDMTRTCDDKTDKVTKKTKKSKKRNKRENDQVADEEPRKRPDPKLGTYLGNKHMRDFVREVDKILNQQR